MTGAGDAKALDPEIEEARQKFAETKAREKAEKEAYIKQENQAMRRRFSSTGADAKELDPAIEEARRQAAEAKARAKAEKEAKVARENAAMKAKLASTGAKSEHFLT